MKTYIALLVALGLVGFVCAADYTPVSGEGGKAATAIAPVSSAVLAVVGGQMQLTAAAVSTNNTIASPVAVGVLCKIINVGTNAVTITDGANIEGAGAVTLGQYDSIMLESISTSLWVELGRSDN